MIKQNVVFVENKAGSLKRVTGILADNGINIYGFACFDAPEFAIFRMICNDSDKAEIKQEWIYESYYTGDRS